MRILILGGTVFYGRALAEAALSAGHQVTLFNRGKSNPGLFPGVEEIHGDRKENLEALGGRSWDAAVDPSGYLPGVVRKSAEFLTGAVDHYTFISSISVYPGSSSKPINEDTPVGQLEDENIEEVTGETYGPLKALSEKAVQAALPGRALVLRPGLIVGPHDPSDRFTYWPHRVEEGGEVLAPGRPARAVQFIDVRDLAEWTLSLLEKGVTGVYNATGPEVPVSMGELLEACQRVSASGAVVTWVTEDFLEAEGVAPWMELPLWIPESSEEETTLNSVDISRALENGLVFRPLEETVRDTLAWARSRPADHKWRAGLSREREQQLLKLWHQRDKT